MVKTFGLVDSFLVFSAIVYIICICNNFRPTNCFPLSQQPKTTTPLRHDTSDYLDILASNTPLLDVRAPIEVSKGAFPNVCNIPLLNDKHRELVGTCYKENGQDAAIALGHTLVDGSTKRDLVQSWKKFVEEHPNGFLYCFRGGLRSHIVQEWLGEAGVHCPLVVGGYKAMRSSLLLDLETSLELLPVVLIGGRTCSGKTIALTRLSRFVDLEGLANHRGSAFGAISRQPQPAQVSFENSIIIECLKHRQSSSSLPIFMEDEGNRIGRLTLPVPMHSPMANQFPLIILETPLKERIDICIQEYIEVPLQTFLAVGEQEGDAHAHIRNEFMGCLNRIQKKLQKRVKGGNGKDIGKDFEEAFDLFETSHASDTSGFCKPIQTLLADYYDPMYDHQMSKRKGAVLFRGNIEALVEFAEGYRATT